MSAGMCRAALPGNPRHRAAQPPPSLRRRWILRAGMASSVICQRPSHPLGDKVELASIEIGDFIRHRARGRVAAYLAGVPADALGADHRAGPAT